MGSRAAFIDRDGVLNEERSFVYRREDFAFIPGSIEALQRLSRAGYRLVVVTNQSGIARGLYTEDDHAALTEHMRQGLGKEGVHLDAVEYCPHLPDAPLPQYRVDCDCRKPKPGMLLRAIRALDLDAGSSFLVGDRISDVQAGRAAGIGQCFLVRTGYELSREAMTAADAVHDDLLACVRQVLERGDKV